MRLKVHQLRIALIAINLVLAGSAALYAFSKYRDLTEKKPSIPIVDARTLIIRDTMTPATTGAQQLVGVAGKVQPKEPPPMDVRPPELPTGEEGTEDGKGGDDDDMPPGPLGDHWEYYHFIIFDDPLDTIVTLRKKDAAAQSPSAAGGAASRPGVRPRPTIRPSRPNLAGQRKTGAVQAPGDSMTFNVKRRKYRDETTDPPLEFMIHAADHKRFVYWMPDDPKKKYALPRETDSPYSDAPEEGLRPRPKPEGETEEETKPKKHFIPRPDEWESDKEKEYKEMLDGAPAGENMNLIDPQEVPSEDTTSKKKEGTSSKKPVPSFSSEKTGQPRTTMTDEEKEQLQKVFKSPKMTAKDRADLEKALMGGKKK